MYILLKNLFNLPLALIRSTWGQPITNDPLTTAVRLSKTQIRTTLIIKTPTEDGIESLEKQMELDIKESIELAESTLDVRFTNCEDHEVIEYDNTYIASVDLYFTFNQ